MNPVLKKIAGVILPQGIYDGLKDMVIAREYIRLIKMQTRVEECLNDLRERDHQIDLGEFLRGSVMPMTLKELTFVRGGGNTGLCLYFRSCTSPSHGKVS